MRSNPAMTVAKYGMHKLGLLAIGLTLTSGCESVWVVPPAGGRVVDIRSQRPIPEAQVTRVCVDAPAKTKTDSSGYFEFQGKRKLQVPFGDPLTTPASYRIEAAGYVSTETNGPNFGWANQRDLRHNLGEIRMQPR
jgi:hypothetical protein